MKVRTSPSHLSILEQAQVALRESDDRFRELAEYARDAFWLVDIETRDVLYLNPGFEAVFGSSSSFEDSVADWHTRCHEDDASLVQARWASAEDEPEWNIQYRIVRPDGEVRWIHERSFPVRDHLGMIYRVAGISEDITDEKLAQDQVEEYRQRLQELTARLDSTAEAERQQIAETLHDDIGQSLALTRIQLGRLSRKLPEEDRLELESVMDLVQTTIDSTRSLMIQMSPPALELGFWPAVDSMVAELKRQTGLKVQLEDNAADVELKRETAMMLYRVVRELLLNTIRHAQTDSAKIRRHSENGSLVVRVEDDGVGFDSSSASHGSLGLLLSGERARMLGGTLTVDSAEGQGTRVTIAIPV